MNKKQILENAFLEKELIQNYESINISKVFVINNHIGDKNRYYVDKF